MEITSSGQAGYVQELYGEQVKKYHLDDLKVYCPREGQFSAATVIHRSAMTHAGFPGQRSIDLNDFFQCGHHFY